MKKSIAAKTLMLSTVLFAAGAVISSDAYGQGKLGDGDFGVSLKIPFVEDYYARLFEDESSERNEEVIKSEGISAVSLSSLYGALYIEVSPDDNIHLIYPSDANFSLGHNVTDGILNITAEVDTPGNSDVLKICIPSGTIEQLDIAGGTSMIHFIGQDDFLKVCNIDVTLATVILENIYADTTVKTTSGTISLMNETVRSNISLNSQYGVVDVELGELPDDVSIYTTGYMVSNAFKGTRAEVSENEKYAVRIENSVGGINIRKAE